MSTMVSDLMLLCNSLPDYTFSFEAYPAGEKMDKAAVSCKKTFNPELYDTFDDVQVFLLESGERNISFKRKLLSKSFIPKAVSIINEFYSVYGADSDGNYCVSNKEIEDLKEPLFDDFYSMVHKQWKKDEKMVAMAWAETNSEFSLTFYNVQHDNIQDLLGKFYQPYVKFEPGGLLTNRKEILNNTKANIISDEFSKGKD